MKKYQFIVKEVTFDSDRLVNIAEVSCTQEEVETAFAALVNRFVSEDQECKYCGEPLKIKWRHLLESDDDNCDCPEPL